MYKYIMKQHTKEPQSSETYLEYMIEELGPERLAEFSQIQEHYVTAQTLVFLIREFAQDSVTITRVFTEEDQARAFERQMVQLLEAAGTPFNTEHTVDSIDYDEFAELESREGVKQYFWYNE